jgi:hypothetical protein
MDLAMNLVRASYDEAPTQKGPTSRRNPFGMARSTWSRMMREELGLRAYKVFKIAMFLIFECLITGCPTCLLMILKVGVAIK